MKKLRAAIGTYIATTDNWLWLLSVGCAVFGVVVIMSLSRNLFSTNRYYLVQGLALGLGVLVAIIASRFDYHAVSELWKWHAVLCWGLVLLTFFIGYQRPGTDDKAWLLLPGGLMLQPAELAKISFAYSFAYHLSSGESVNSARRLIPLLVHLALPVLLVHFQGDDGTAIVFGVMGISMLFAAGLSMRYVVSAAVAAAAAAPLVWFYLLDDHKRKRFLTILFPESDPLGVGWQQYLGRVSIGAGQIFGKGLFDNTLRKIPEVQNDFIFAYIGETLGFMGATGVLILLVALIARIFRVARNSGDSLGFFICVGIGSYMACQIVLNVGMCLSVLPVVGVTLPFFSSGGTSLVTTFISIGVVQGVYSANRPNIFSNAR